MLVLPSDNNSPWTNYPRETEPVRWFWIRKQHSIMDWLFKRKPSEQCALENLLHFNNLLKRKANRNISSSAWGKGGGEIKWKFTCLSMPSSLSSLFHFENDDHNCKDNDNDNNNKINNNDNYNNYNNNYNEKVRVSLASTLQKIQPTNWSWIPYRNCIAAGHWGTQATSPRQGTDIEVEKRGLYHCLQITTVHNELTTQERQKWLIHYNNMIYAKKMVNKNDKKG